MKSSQFFLSAALMGFSFLLSISPSIAFDPPPGQGSPGSTGGGASRPIQSSCLTEPNSTENLTLLAPKTYLGLTTQARPTFWVYLPPSQAKVLEFSVLNQQRQGLYQIQIPIENKQGLTQITLPETAPELKMDQLYTWVVALVCNPKRRTEDWVVNGWIRRQTLTPQQQQQLHPRLPNFDRAQIYAQAQFWYDAIPYLIQFSNAEQWSSLLKDAGLHPIKKSTVQTRSN